MRSKTLQHAAFVRATASLSITNQNASNTLSASTPAPIPSNVNCKMPQQIVSWQSLV